MSVKRNNTSILLRSGKVSCTCCPGLVLPELSIIYSWADTGMTDLDTKTAFVGEQVGWSCGSTGLYTQWLPGSTGGQDDTSLNGFEHVNILVDSARLAGLWTSSVNVELFAGWYIPRGGSGEAVATVQYNGNIQGKAINPGSQSGCTNTPVGTIIIYDNGTFDLL